MNSRENVRAFHNSFFLFPFRFPCWFRYPSRWHHRSPGVGHLWRCVPRSVQRACCGSEALQEDCLWYVCRPERGCLLPCHVQGWLWTQVPWSGTAVRQPCLSTCGPCDGLRGYWERPERPVWSHQRWAVPSSSGPGTTPDLRSMARPLPPADQGRRTSSQGESVPHWPEGEQRASARLVSELHVPCFPGSWCQRRETLIPGADAEDLFFSFFLLLSSDFCLFTKVSMVLFDPDDCFNRHILAYFIWFWWAVILRSASMTFLWDGLYISAFILELKEIMGKYASLSPIGCFLIRCPLVLVGCYTC